MYILQPFFMNVEGRVDCLVVPSESVNKQMQFTLHATLFSLTHKTALGNVWASLPTTPQQSKSGTKSKGKVDGDGATWNLNINEVHLRVNRNGKPENYRSHDKTKA